MKNKIRILIADDHPVTREGLALILNNQDDMQVVAEASNGTEAVALFKKHLPSLAILDVQMPEMGGAAATDEIVRSFPAAKIILFTTYDGTEDIFRGMKAGAKAYLLKDTPRSTILDAIHTVHNGQKFITPNVASKLAEVWEADRLSDKQQMVLNLLSQGLSNRDIADQLSVTEGTIKTHVNAIFQKLRVFSRTEAVVEAQKRGLLRL